MFRILGLLVGLYTVYAVVTGRVLAKSGPWGTTVTRAESPDSFWVVIVIYAMLALALVTVF